MVVWLGGGREKKWWGVFFLPSLAKLVVKFLYKMLCLYLTNPPRTPEKTSWGAINQMEYLDVLSFVML